MLHSLYDHLCKLEDADQQQVKDALVNLGIAYIFEDVLKDHWTDGWFKPIVLFAAHTYCWESPMVRLGQDFRRCKVRIAERVKLPLNAYDAVIDLQDTSIAMCLQAFLSLYRDNFDYVDLANKKDLYQQIMRAANTFKADESGNIDLEAKTNAAKTTEKMAQDIKRLEAELLEKYRKFNPANEEFRQMDRGNPLRIENSPHMRK